MVKKLKFAQHKKQLYKMKKYLLIIFSLSLVSCSFDKIYDNRDEDKNDAQKITEKFYYFILQDNSIDAFKLFSNTFF